MLCLREPSQSSFYRDKSFDYNQNHECSFLSTVGKYPQFQLPPRNKYVVQKGKPLTIPCKAIGNPEPVMKWHFKDDPSPLQNNSEYSIHKSGSLEIKNVSSQDAGNYKCTAENMVGTIAKDTVVELACKYCIYLL